MSDLKLHQINLIKTRKFFQFLVIGKSIDGKHERWKTIPPGLRAVIIGVPVVIFFIVLALLYVTTKIRSEGAVFIAARTEILEYRPSSEDPPRWYLKNAEFDTGSGSLDVPAGYLEFEGKSTILLQRIGHADMFVNVEVEKRAVILSESDEFIQELGKRFSFKLSNPTDLLKNGERLVFPLVGDILPGRITRFETGANGGLLIDGTVELIARKTLTNQHYKIGPIPLTLGDKIILPNSKFGSRGFLTIDSKSGFNVVFSNNSPFVQIQRFGTEPISVIDGVFSRIYHDSDLTIAWSLVIGIFLVYGHIVRSILWAYSGSPYQSWDQL